MDGSVRRAGGSGSGNSQVINWTIKVTTTGISDMGGSTRTRRKYYSLLVTAAHRAEESQVEERHSLSVNGLGCTKLTG